MNFLSHDAYFGKHTFGNPAVADTTFIKRLLVCSLASLMLATPNAYAKTTSYSVSEPTLLAQEMSQTISHYKPLSTVTNVPSDDGLDNEVANQNPPKQNLIEQDLSLLDTAQDPLAGIDGLHPTRVPLNAISPETLKTFVAVVDLVRRQHISNVNDEELFKDAMSGMLTRLDDHAEFLDAQAFKNLQSFTAGSIANVGISVDFSQKDNHWVISRVEKNSPADIAEINVGDYLHQINDTKLSESKSQNDVEQLLNGIAGTQVELTVSKTGRSKRTIYLQRNHIQASSLDVKMYQGVAVVRIPVFQDNTRQQLVESLIRINTPIQGMVLDLRNNPGGVLESAIAIASLFVENEPLVQIADRQKTQTLTAFGETPFNKIPVVVLQNRYSASAAEVLAAGLQFNKQAIIMGETSYGKGSVQSVIPIDAAQAVKLTTAYYQKPNGKEIENIGIIPDVAFKDDESLWLIHALDYLDKHKLNQGISVSVSNDY